MPDLAKAARAIRNAAFFSCSPTAMRGCYRPTRDAFANRVEQMRHRRQHQLEFRALLPQQAQRLAEHRHVMPDFAAAASRQHQQHRRLCVAASLLVGIGPKRADLLDQGMADIGARRPLEPAIGFRLERQQRQHVIDVAAHGARAAGPPCPHGGRDIVDDRYRRRPRPDLPRDAMGKVGTVDDHQDIGGRHDGGIGSFTDARAGSSAVFAPPR